MSAIAAAYIDHTIGVLYLRKLRVWCHLYCGSYSISLLFHSVWMMLKNAHHID